MAERAEQAGKKFSELVEVMARLRAPGGCPWDRKQSFETIKTYLLEETYEVMDAIDRQDWRGLQEELGDLLLQPVFFAEMAAEQGLFTVADSLDAINQKLVRRHPHVFGTAHAETPEDVKVRWDEIKKQEKAEQGVAPATSVLDEVPRNLPALMEADKVSHKAAGLGFDWPDVGGVLAKVREEAEELVHAQQTGDRQHVDHELGDLLFTVVNLARYLKVDPEQALRKTNARFRQRFAHVEQRVAESGKPFAETSLDQMENWWQEAKKLKS
jgi:tetrapyrrole methylase family protein / MazG family protein